MRRGGGGEETMAEVGREGEWPGEVLREPPKEERWRDRSSSLLSLRLMAVNSSLTPQPHPLITARPQLTLSPNSFPLNLSPTYHFP